MVVAENQEAPKITVRSDIPDSWGANGHCPACGAVPLEVIHIPDLPDYMICRKCELSFELADNASQLRVKNLPDNLGFAESELRFRWVTPGAIQKLIENRSAYLQRKTVPENKGILTDDDVWERALSFHRLGNKPQKIAYVLIQAGASREQADAALERLKQWIVQDSNRQSRKLAWVGGIAALVVALLFTGWFMLLGQINAQLDEGLANPATNGEPVIALRSAADILPDAIKPGFLKSGPVTVSNSGPDRSRCPSDPNEAAKLFGGSAGVWQRASQPGAWQMVHTGVPSTIRIPAGMVGGYIDNTTFMFLSANGPATLKNINFIAIVCE